MKKKPLYILFSEELKNLLEEGSYTYGSLFPAERELAEKHKIDRKTIRKALNILVDEHLLVRVKGKGTYVRQPDIEMPMNKILGFTRNLRQQGVKVETKVLENEQQVCGYRMAKRLNIQAFDTVNHLIRVRTVSGQPVVVEETYVVDRIPDFQKMDFEVNSLYELYIQNNMIPSQVQEEIDVAQVSGRYARVLGVEDETNVFYVTDLTRDQNGDVMEYNMAYSRSDRIKMSTELV